MKTANSETVPNNEEIQFDFYTELPNMQVSFPGSIQKIYKKPAEVANLSGKIDESIQSVIAAQAKNNVTKRVMQFVVQVGEFNDQLNASQLRLSLLLAGIETEIVKTDDHHYRVQRGPYASVRQAKAFQHQLSKKGFDGSIKEF